MTVTITQDITDIAGIDDNSVLWFYQQDHPRVADDGMTMISTRRVSATPVDGTLTIELEPGPAVVQIGLRTYEIQVPDLDGTLWPLIEAGLPVPPAEEATAVRNGGGIARMQRITQAAFDALPAPDPETLYVIKG
ncbi:hypothetical protein IU421_14625 [Nocardia cyriacigeorgica]|uniref:phage upper tail fiber protein n=1 Tax=Nocardia cyriacigeorgica TaxID=135487 RepID=UPI001894F615|nr:hypothetical protein [Nocardia cyriacigeorgica]MBF6515505.1 hypothetical protein [Nocardia cyriacigeorgica]